MNGDRGSIPVLFDCSTRPAGAVQCGWPELVQLFQQGIRFGIYIATIVAIFVIIRTGFKIMTSGSADELKEAKTALWKVLVGYFFMLCAWLIVKTILTMLGVGEDYQLLAPNQ